MKRVKLIVAYDGTNYCGWQIQPNGITIQGLLNQHLSALLGEEIKTMGASRTDSGVHAHGNVAVFDTTARMPVDKISFALNTRLPEDIKIQSSVEVPADFHPRFCNTIKTYEYRILNRTFADPNCRFNTLFYYFSLDVAAMEKASRYLEGEHDFKGFATEVPQVDNTVRTIYKTTLVREGDIIRFQVTGNGFLYNMVRIIVGTLLEVGKGAYEPEHILEIFNKKDRNLAGPTARAHGLSLIEIKYPDLEGLQ